MTKSTVVFSHGQDSEPWGTKALALAEVARELGFPMESVDYRDSNDPEVRVKRLLEFCNQRTGPFILVGSSLGGHVAGTVSALIPTRGLFFLAPAFYMHGYEQYTPQPAKCPITIVHGWGDDVVPVANSIRFGGEHRVTLHIVDGGHRLTENISQLCQYFRLFLLELESSSDLAGTR
jgi:surfactin synthase thioesterase subunit